MTQATQEHTQDSIILELNTKETVEEKLRFCLSSMREGLAVVGGPNFKQFWEIKKACLLLFKENIAPALRATLWEDYLALSEEMRMAKDHLDEDAKFAAQQIDLAIEAIEKEVVLFSEDIHLLIKNNKFAPLPESPKTLQGNYKEYCFLQNRIDTLTLFTSKVNALRQELIKMPLRMRIKAKFFERLSKLGDHLFPLRRELIAEMSESFLSDIEKFVQRNFSEDTPDREHLKRSVFFFREEIKSLQALAKVFSLNTHAFSTTRTSLSFCWDQLKGIEKELKKEYAEQKVKSAENIHFVHEKLNSLKIYLDEEGSQPEEAQKMVNDILKFMRSIELTRKDVMALKEQLAQIMAPLEEKQKEQEQAKQMQIAEEEENKRLLFEGFVEKVRQFYNSLGAKDIEELSKQLDAYKKESRVLTVNKNHKLLIDKELKIARDKLSELREQRMLSLCKEDKCALETLEKLLEEKRLIRAEVKGHLEECRRKKGATGLDFLKALEIEEIIEKEKEQLVKIDQTIEEIQSKIQSFS